MKSVLLAVCLIFITTLCFAETYTGKAENVKIETSKLIKGSDIETPMGISFEVVVKDSQGKEVARIKDYVATGVMTGDEAVLAVKNEVDRKTMEIYAHVTGANDALKKKSEIESYSKSVDKFIASEIRPSPDSIRIE